MTVDSSRVRPVMTVAIIGGGFTGAAVAINLRRKWPGNPQDLNILVFEPREELGRGLAYDTADPAHRINVPVGKMSLDPTDEGAFERWFFQTREDKADPASLGPDGRHYARREAFGRYVHQSVKPFLAAGEIEHVQARVDEVRFENSHYILLGSDGRRFAADVLVVATSHPQPGIPAALGVLGADPRLVPDPAVQGALDGLSRDDRVLIIGSGLTSADVIASLDASGHRGPITVFSRRGLRSHGHAPVIHPPFGDFVSEPSRTVRQLVRRVRRAVTEAAGEDIGWQAVFDAVRAQGSQIWRALPIEERRRLVRHIRPFWDVHRFRIAPQVRAVADRLVTEGRLRFLAASLAGIDYAGPDLPIGVTLKPRGSEAFEAEFDAIIITTGPAHKSIIALQPYLQSLNGLGLVRLDDTGLGLACDTNGRALDLWGASVPGLYIAGPLARGTFGELMGLPQVSEQAALVADEIRLELGKRLAWLSQHMARPLTIAR